MKKLLTAAVIGMALSPLTHAATFTFQDNSTGASAQTVDGITVSFTALQAGEAVAYYGGIINAEKGIGINGVSCCDSAALGNSEAVTVTFSSAVTIDSIRMGQWQGPDKVFFTSAAGNFTFDAETAIFSSYETFDISSLGAITSFTLIGGSTGTQATLNQLIGVTSVPVPAAAWLFGSALIGLAGIGRKRGITA